MKTLTSYLLLAFLATTAFSQCPIFYHDYNLQGLSFQLCTSSNVPLLFNDVVSSFTVPTGYIVTLYADAGFSGEYWGPYTAGSYNVPTSFNDKMSSGSVFPVQATSPACPTFYINYGLQGNNVQICNSGNLPAAFNDQISSMVVPAGYAVQLYTNINQGGQVYGPFSAGLWDVPIALNDQTSSVTISNYEDDDSTDEELNTLQCPLFYVNTNLQGASFQMCASGNAPSQYNDQASSFIVPAGFLVYLYGNTNYGGDYWGPYAEGRYNMPINLNDQLSSVIVQSPGSTTSGVNSVSTPVVNPNPSPVTVINTESAVTNTETSSATTNTNSNSNSTSASTNSNCPLFYLGVNQSGSSFQLCTTGNVPTAFDNQASSLYVPENHVVTLYGDHNTTGTQSGPYTAGFHNIPTGFNNQMSSAVINKLF